MRRLLPALVLLALASPAWAAIDVRQYGVSESMSDNSPALQRAFDDARRTGQDVYIPPGTYSYRSQLVIDGITVSGAGSDTRLVAQVPTQQRIKVTGGNASLSNLRIEYKDLIRDGSDHGRKGVMVEDARGFAVRNVTFAGPENARYGGGALFVYRSSGGRIEGNTLINTAADAIHITSGSTNMTVTGNTVRGAGDDGIAVVNNGGTYDSNVVIRGNSVTGNRWGRNITAVGAQGVRILDNFISGNAADGAGIYVASEDSYNTAIPRDVLIEGNTIQDTGGPGKGHGQIMIFSGRSGGTIRNVTVRGNDVRDSKRQDLAVVVSGSTENITLEGNRIDGDITRRGGDFENRGDQTGTGSGSVPAPNLVGGTPSDPASPPITPPDPAIVPVPPGQPPIPPVPTALTPTVPPVVYPPPAAVPVAPLPPAPATVLTNIANSPVLSQATPLGPGVLNGIVDTFTGQAGLWKDTLQGLALELFAILAGIEVAWVVARALARRVDFGDMIEIVAMQIITIGFFYWLLINSADFVLAIVASFGEAANRASVAGGGMTNLSPSDIFTSGLNMVKIIWDGISITSPGLSTLLVLAGLINSYVYAVITAKLIEVLVETAFVAYAGIIMMGFGGSSFTREYAIAQFRYAISVGVKRFVLQLIVGLAQGIITGWATTVASSGALNWTTIGIMVGAPIVMLRLCETLPQRAQDMVMGVSTYSGGHLGHTAASVAATAGAAAAGLAGAGAATKAAYQLAAKEIAQRGQQSGQTPGFAQRAAMTAGLTARNLGSAIASDVGKRMIGHNRFGHRSWRMAHDLRTRPIGNSQHGNNGP